MISAIRPHQLAAALVAAAIIAGYIALTISGRDVAPYIVFCSGPMITAIVTGLLSGSGGSAAGRQAIADDQPAAAVAPARPSE